ncbi:MAG: hypothetical protein KDD42_08875, partial [Bdellovibrionales bacterium]|nr:hypothetical protein [Bdellovibrionales bacterium]
GWKSFLRVRNSVFVILILSFYGVWHVSNLHTLFIEKPFIFKKDPGVNQLLADLQQTTEALDLETTDRFTLGFYTDGIGIWNIGDYLPYFYPAASLISQQSKSFVDYSPYCRLEVKDKGTVILYLEELLCPDLKGRLIEEGYEFGSANAEFRGKLFQFDRAVIADHSN